MGKSFIYIVVILFSSLLLAIGWVDLSMGSKRIELGPLGLPVSYACNERIAARHGVEFDQMTAARKAILSVKKHVRSVEMSIDENEGKAASYVVSVVMNSGSRVQTRMDSLSWQRLDRDMALAIQRCVDEFMAFKRERPGQTGAVVLNI